MIQEAEARLNVLRKRAGSPEENDNLPSTSSAPAGDSLVERHRKEKARQEKRERRQKERLDFDFPTDAARRESKQNAAAPLEEEVGGDGGRWETNGHVNLFADLERKVSSN